MTSCVHKMCERMYGQTNMKKAITLAKINHSKRLLANCPGRIHISWFQHSLHSFMPLHHVKSHYNLILYYTSTYVANMFMGQWKYFSWNIHHSFNITSKNTTFIPTWHSLFNILIFFIPIYFSIKFFNVTILFLCC
jgi:hypothetical protein